MGTDTLSSPTVTSISRHSLALSQESPSPPTEAAAGLNSPWFDPLSPNLRDYPGFSPRHDSQMGLMESNMNYNHFGDPDRGRRREPQAWWKMLLISKWSMIMCLMFGVGGALGHHFLYAHLHNHEAHSQRWWLRLGQFISFVAKANLVVAVVMAHGQVAWRAVGQKGFSVEAIDSLFGSAHNAIELFNREAWAKSWMAMFLAVYLWASPFVVIFTSATLDVVPGTIEKPSVCQSVRTLNFANEAKESWRTQKIAENNTLKGLSLSYYNETYSKGNLAPEKNDTDLDIFEYWDRPSSALESIFSGVVASGRAIQRTNVARDICGEGWDCSTTVDFLAPGYKCTKLANGTKNAIKKFGEAVPPFHLNDLFPTGNFTYLANTTQGDYARPQMEVKEKPGGGIPVDGPPFPERLGAFRTEPIMWVGYAAVKDVTKTHAKNSSEKGWDTDYTPIIFACEHWETNYTVKFNYTAGLQTYNVTRREYRRKIIPTTYKNDSADDGTKDGTVAVPESEYILPRTEYATYRKIAAYHSLGKKLRTLLSGSSKSADSIISGDVATSKLLDRHENLPVPDLENAVRQLYEDVLISLLSDPQLLVVAWAANSSRLSGSEVGGEDTGYECVRRRTSTFFFYQWEVLVAVYAISFVIASVGVAYGIFAMHKDGVTKQREITFSSIAVATRKVKLDEDRDRETEIRCWPVEEYPGVRLYEFRAERHGA